MKAVMMVLQVVRRLHCRFHPRRRDIFIIGTYSGSWSAQGCGEGRKQIRDLEELLQTLGSRGTDEGRVTPSSVTSLKDSPKAGDFPSGLKQEWGLRPVCLPHKVLPRLLAKLLARVQVGLEQGWGLRSFNTQSVFHMQCCFDSLLHCMQKYKLV
jgi:hypothetical protein